MSLSLNFNNNLYFYALKFKNTRRNLKKSIYETIKIKYIEINLIKEVQDLQTENYKSIVERN